MPPWSPGCVAPHGCRVVPDARAVGGQRGSGRAITPRHHGQRAPGRFAPRRRGGACQHRSNSASDGAATRKKPEVSRCDRVRSSLPKPPRLVGLGEPAQWTLVRTNVMTPEPRETSDRAGSGWANPAGSAVQPSRSGAEIDGERSRQKPRDSRCLAASCSCNRRTPLSSNLDDLHLRPSACKHRVPTGSKVVPREPIDGSAIRGNFRKQHLE